MQNCTEPQATHSRRLYRRPFSRTLALSPLHPPPTTAPTPTTVSIAASMLYGATRRLRLRHRPQDAALFRLPRAYARHVQAEVQRCGYCVSGIGGGTERRAGCRTRFHSPVDVSDPLPCRRHRRHQGQRCPAAGYAAQVLPRVCANECLLCGGNC